MQHLFAHPVIHLHLCMSIPNSLIFQIQLLFLRHHDSFQNALSSLALRYSNIDLYIPTSSSLLFTKFFQNKFSTTLIVIQKRCRLRFLTPSNHGLYIYNLVMQNFLLYLSYLEKGAIIVQIMCLPLFLFPNIASEVALN